MEERSLPCPKCKYRTNWLSSPSCTVVVNGEEFEGQVIACPRCEFAAIMEVKERLCGICGREESKHQNVQALTGPGHFFVRRTKEMEIKEPEDSRGMLLVQMEPGRIVGLHFRHRRVETIVRGIKSMVIVTRAAIYAIPPDDETGPPKLICYGVAKCSPLDNFSRETGRKIALTRALLEGMHEFATSKDKREIIWKAYFDRVPKKPQEPPVEPAIEGVILHEQKLLSGVVEEPTVIH